MPNPANLKPRYNRQWDVEHPLAIQFMEDIKNGLQKEYWNLSFHVSGEGKSAKVTGYTIQFHDRGYDVIKNDRYKNIEIWEHQRSGMWNKERHVVLPPENVQMMKFGMKQLTKALELKQFNAFGPISQWEYIQADKTVHVGAVKVHTKEALLKFRNNLKKLR